MLDCDTGDGMGSCPIETLVAADTATTVADAFDPAVLEATPEATAENNEPVIRSVDTIPAKVNETTVISAIGDSDTAIEDAAQSLAITLPAAEPASENTTTSDASVFRPNEERAEAPLAIVVELTPSSTVAVPGQPVADEPVVSGSIAEPSPATPVSMTDSKDGDEDF